MSTIDKMDEGPVYCQELSTGNNLSGTIEIRPEKIEALIYRFDEHFFIKNHDPILLRTAHNTIVSLYDNSTTAPGSRSRCVEPVRVTRCQRITSSMAVTGYDEWNPDDPVKRVSFMVPHTEEVVRHRSRFERLANPRTANEEDFTLYSERVDNLSISAWYRVQGFDHATEVDAVFDIEFDSPKTVHSYLNDVTSYVQFFSFCVAMPLTPTTIKLSRRSREAELRAIAAKESVEEHTAHYTFAASGVGPPRLGARASPILARSNSELAALQACIVVWMERRVAWRKAYEAMSASFSFRNEISSERLMAAWRWFEEIPNSKAQSAMSESDIAAIADAAEKKAIELKHGGIANRVRGAVRRIRLESNKDWFARLVDRLKQVFGSATPFDRMVHDLCAAAEFRGKSAHGHFIAEDETEMRAFYRATCAMEALCYLMTAIELPLCEEGSNRIWSNPTLEHYALAY